MWFLFRSLFGRARRFVSVGRWSGISALVLVLTAFYGDSYTVGMVLLVGILILLLIGGIVLLALGIIDLVRDLRKWIHPHPRT